MADDKSIENFGASFKGFLDHMAAQAPAEEPVFLRILREHFNTEPAAFPIVGETFEGADHPNLQRALDAYLSERGRSSRLIGMTGDQAFSYGMVGLAQLIMPAKGGLWGGASVVEGPVQYVNVGLENEKVVACVQSGVYLIRDSQYGFAVLVRGPNEMRYNRTIQVEVMAPDRERAERLLADLRVLMRKHNVYRGRVISLGLGQNHDLQVNFHRLPEISREQIILPEGLLNRVERQTVGFAKHSDKLLKMGRHLKRGLLLHGAPGTGKTLTAMYLASTMRDRTVLLLTGRAMNLIQQSCAMARVLQPSMVVMEDVDLIAEERTREGACTVLLFELLNQMDGLADDADIVFLLTTNRPDILEPALASRPGRIDQALEVPLPDATCRKRLFQLYSDKLNHDYRIDHFVAQTDGASAALIRELLRKAALFAADEFKDEPVVSDRHLTEALRELMITGGDLTKSLLGVRKPA